MKTSFSSTFGKNWEPLPASVLLCCSVVVFPKRYLRAEPGLTPLGSDPAPSPLCAHQGSGVSFPSVPWLHSPPLPSCPSTTRSVQDASLCLCHINCVLEVCGVYLIRRLLQQGHPHLELVHRTSYNQHSLGPLPPLHRGICRSTHHCFVRGWFLLVFVSLSVAISTQ